MSSFPLPHWSGWSRLNAAIRIEEYTIGNVHIVRIEAPGLDPADELDVAVADHEVTVEVRPRLRAPTPTRSELPHTAAKRRITLPDNAIDDTLTATYDDEGILELRVNLTQPAPIARRVPIVVRSALVH